MLWVWILTTKARKFRANFQSLGLILVSHSCHINSSVFSNGFYWKKHNLLSEALLRGLRYGSACALSYLGLKANTRKACRQLRQGPPGLHLI